MRINPLLQRTPLQRWHQSYGGEMSGQLVSNYPESEPALLGLTDLTALPRLGFKGADTIAWLQSHGHGVPEHANLAAWDDNILALRLSDTEVLMAATRAGHDERIDHLRGAWSMGINERTYLLERAHSHACFALTGSDASNMLAKLCGIDLRAEKFNALRLAQTSLARINAIIVRTEHTDEPRFLIFADMSSAEYLWDCILDAMQEFNGGPLSYPHYLERV